MSILSRLNAWRTASQLWREPDPPDFHWRLLRYFCWTRLAVALVLLGYVWLPGQGESARGGGLADPAALPVVWPYLAISVGMAISAFWRHRFHVRVRFQVLVDLILLGLAYHVLVRHGRADGLAMIFLLPALEAGALTSLSFALFSAAMSSMLLLALPFTQTLLNRQADTGLLASGLYGLVLMIAALAMHMLANRQVAQERIALVRERELRLQQLVHRLMVNDMQDGVMLMRATGAVVAANPAALVLLGVQPHERNDGRQHRVAERAGEYAGVLFDMRSIARLRPMLEMLRDWVRSQDDVPRILQVLPPVVPRMPAGAPMPQTRLRLRFVLPGLAGLNSTLAGPAGLDAAETAPPAELARLPAESATRLRLAIAQAEAMAWSPEDEALLRSEMRDTVLVHIESWERIAEQAQQEKLAAMGRLVASVAHQIRNPLAAISQAGELLAETGRGGDGNMDARLLRIIRDNVHRLDQVVADVLQMSRRPRTGRSALDLRQALPEIVDRWRVEMRTRGLREALEGDTRLARPGDINANAIRIAVNLPRPVVFEQAQMQQVLGNLLDNAWRYCSRLPGSIRLMVQGLDQHHAELIVWNDGAEVSREHQRSLFEPFFTSRAQGTGLGLFMARELCGANDAQVRYGSIALDALLDATGVLAPAARDTLPAKAFVLTLRIATPETTAAAAAAAS